MNTIITRHAEARCGQRGFRKNDLKLIAEYGTETKSGFLLTNKDIIKVERQFKKILADLSRLQNAFIPMAEDGITTKTVFRATKEQRRRETRRW